MPGWDRASSEAALDLASRHADMLDAAVGIHPHYVAAAADADWAAIEHLARESAARAVGEIGLDFFRNLSPPAGQRDALARQLDLAARVGKPVVVHDRDAHGEVTDALLEHAKRLLAARPALPGVLHAFSGDARMAERLAAAGYLISFALPVTFRSNHGSRQAAAALAAAHLLVETDSPYLGVAPNRRNEPTTTLRVAAALARLRGQTPDEIAAEAAASYGRVIGSTLP